MTAAFAAVEARANAAVMRRLANAEAVIGGTSYPVIFDAPFLQTDLNVGAQVPTATFLDTDVAAAAIASNSTLMVIKGRNWRAVDQHPDGVGFTVVVLQEA